MQAGEKLNLEQIRTLLEATGEVQFAGQNRDEIYGWVTQMLCHQEYFRQRRPVRGLLRQYAVRMTGLSRAQVTRLIGRYRGCGEVKPAKYRRHGFARRFTNADIALLATVDEAHETLSGPATKRILEREFQQYGKCEYERLSTISTGHLYNLRKTRAYRQRRVRFEATHGICIPIGERRCPKPEGQPGYLRVDTVHQGDREGQKGLYHVNAVDEVTQWQIVGATAFISEAWLMPVLEAMLEQFPFTIRGFHSDNGSEFINGTVAKLLNKLLIEQTKSRPRRSNDNGLVEAKNGAVIRKHIGYGHIAAEHAGKMEDFYERHFNRYLNFHRPSGQPELVTGEKGKQKRIYRRYATPWEVLQGIPEAPKYLKAGQSLEALGRIAGAVSDTECARRMQEAKRKLFGQIEPERRSA
ncbi:MAG: integrase [Chthoniobacterales bacterium]|nr:MAG: integrase [Chthoniobacterales bacterium]